MYFTVPPGFGLKKYTWPGISVLILETWNVTDVLQNFLTNLDWKKWHHLLSYSEGTVCSYVFLLKLKKS